MRIMKIQIIIADDHEMVMEGIVQLLHLDSNFEVVETFGSGEEAMKYLKNNEPDLFLLDIDMPNQNGIDILKKCKEQKIKTKIIILTLHNKIEYVIDAIKNECDGYVLKDSKFSVLKEAIYSVIAGEKFIEPDLVPIVNNRLANSEAEKEYASKLTKREREILILLATGICNKDIGARLGISERTVKNHISSLFRKIKVNDRTQAAIYAIKYNIIDIQN